MIVTIDGPAGAGKSSAAKLLARRLGFEFLDTGAMYRAVTWAALRGGVDLTDRHALETLVSNMQLDMSPGRVALNGEDITGMIRAKEITNASGAIASSPAVRRRLVEMQQTIALGRDLVCEGRDQGTVVFPDAFCKFFLTADPVERAKRRQLEMAGRGEQVPWQEVLAAQQTRDARDSARDIGPMVPAVDAIHLDTTTLALEQVVDQMEAKVRARMGASPS
jgi:cytidylate kinase